MKIIKKLTLIILTLSIFFTSCRKKKEQEICENVKQQKIEATASYKKEVERYNAAVNAGVLSYTDAQVQIQRKTSQYEATIENLNSQCIYTKYN